VSQTDSSPGRPDYGLDAPEVVRRLAVIGTVACVLGMAGFFFFRASHRALAIALLSAGMFPGISLLTTVSVMVWGSKVGKLRLRDRLLDGLALRGDETVLDVGCGHGLLLIGAAKRLPRGRAVGIDLWQTEDQAGNSPDATRANARAEQVIDRIELKTGDARRLPFEEATFDAVVSSWALHNIYDREGRRQALLEIVRVLKPGGRAAILDIRHTAEYAEVFRQNGLGEIKRSRPNFTFFIPTLAVHARKPT